MDKTRGDARDVQRLPGRRHRRRRRRRGRRTIGCPTLVLWGSRGPLRREPDVLAVGRAWAPAATGYALDCGHYVAEERPAETVAAVRELLRC